MKGDRRFLIACVLGGFIFCAYLDIGADALKQAGRCVVWERHSDPDHH